MKLSEMPVVTWVATVLACISTALAMMFRENWIGPKDPYGFVLLTFWALVPPVWLLYEYVSNCPAGSSPKEGDMDRLRQIQELSRNIWLAFLIVLAAIMDLDWPR